MCMLVHRRSTVCGALTLSVLLSSNVVSSDSGIAYSSVLKTSVLVHKGNLQVIEAGSFHGSPAPVYPNSRRNMFILIKALSCLLILFLASSTAA